MAPRREELKPQLVKEARAAGFLVLPEKPLQNDEALSQHYLDLRLPSSRFSWQRAEEHPQGAEAADSFARLRVVQPSAPLPRPLPPDGIEAPRWRRSLQVFSNPRRPSRRTRRSSDAIIKRVLDVESDSAEESEEDAAAEKKAERAEGQEDSEKAEDDPRTLMLMAVAEVAIKGFSPGTLVNESVQDEITERLWRETRVLGLDAVSPLAFLVKALAAADHSWWQIELAMKVLTQKLGAKERNEIAKNALCQDEFGKFIQDMQSGLSSTSIEVMRFDSYARSSAYQRICNMVGSAKDCPDGLRVQQELLLRSLRDGVHNLTSVKKVIEESHRLLHEARLAELEQQQWSADLPRRRDSTNQFLTDMEEMRQQKSMKLEEDFQVAGRRFGRILEETKDLEKLAVEHERKAEAQAQALVELEEEYRDLQEKVRRTKQGSDRHKGEYQAYKQDLEDQRDTLTMRVKGAQRIVDGHDLQMESYQRDLQELIVEEVAKDMQEEAERKVAKAKQTREKTQAMYQDAQERLRTVEDLLGAMKASFITGNVMEELMRKKQEVPRLAEEAQKVEAQMARDRQRLAELQSWLREFGQPEVAAGCSRFVEAAKSRVLDLPELPKASKSSPLQMAMVLARLLPRQGRRLVRKANSQPKAEDCPEFAWRRRALTRSRLDAVAEKPGLELPTLAQAMPQRSYYCDSRWRWRLLRSFSAPGLLDRERRPVRRPSPRKPGRKSAIAAGAVSITTEGSQHGSRRPSLIEELEGPLAVEPFTYGSARRAPAPAWRWPTVEVPWECWRQTWLSLWEDAQQVFEAVPPDAFANEGVPMLQGELCISYFWTDCHLHLQRLRATISQGLRSLLQLRSLERGLKNAQQLLGEKRRTKARRGQAPTDEEREEQELHVLADGCRKLIEECTQAFQEGLKWQQEQMWFAASLLAQLCGLREALLDLLRRVKAQAEEQEDLVFTCRVLAQAAKLPGLEVPAVAKKMRAWQQSAQLNTMSLLQQHKDLAEEWRQLMGREGPLSQAERQRGPVLAQKCMDLEEAVTDLCTAMHCTLENRWMRRKAVDRGEHLDWQKRAVLIKAGSREPLEDSARLASKVKRSEERQQTALLKKRTRLLDSGSVEDPLSDPSPERPRPRSPDLEAAIAELMAQMVMQQELVTGAPTLRSGSREESLSRSESPASLVRGSPSLSCSPVLDAERGDPSVRSARGGGRVPQFLLDGDIEAIGPVESREGDSEWSPRKSQSSRGRESLRGEASPEGRSQPRSSGGSRSRSRASRGDSMASGPDSLSPHKSRESQALLQQSYQELLQKRLDSVSSPEDREYQAKLLEKAYKEMRKSLSESADPYFLNEDEDEDLDLIDVVARTPSARRLGGSRSISSGEGSREVEESSGSESVRHARSDSEALLETMGKSPRKGRRSQRVKSRSWAQSEPSPRSPRRLKSLRELDMRSPKAICLELPERPVRLRSGRRAGRRRLEPLLLPWQPQDPKELHLGTLGTAYGHDRRASRRRSTSPAPLQSEKELRLKRDALVNQVPGSRAGTPPPEDAERKAMEEVMLTRPQSAERPLSAESVRAAGTFIGLSVKSRDLRPRSASHSSIGGSSAERMLPDEEPSPRGMRRYHTREDVRLSLGSVEAPASQLSLEDLRSALEERWRPIDPDKLKELQERDASIKVPDQAEHEVPVQPEDKPADEAYLDAPLDETLMRPTTPAWLQGVVRAITPLRNELSGVLECDDDGPGKISEFALAQSPETESTPSPWPWQPKVEEVLGRRPSMPVPSPFSRASTGTPCSFLAQGQRCRAGSVASVPEEATRACLPAIRIPSPDVDSVSQAMGARGQEVPKLPETPELEPVAPTELKGPRMDRWLRPVTPLEGRASAAQEHGGEAAKPGPDEGPSSRRSSPERGSRPSTARPASRPVSGTPRASERRAEASAYIHAVAAAQRLKVEGPRTSRGTRTPEMPQIRASDAKRESEASVAMAATVAQQQLMAKLNPGLQSKGKARAKDGSAKGWFNVLAKGGEPKAQRVLPQGFTAQLTSDFSRLAATGRLRIPQGRIPSKS